MKKKEDLFMRERVWERGGGQRERERKADADSVLSTEPLWGSIPRP